MSQLEAIELFALAVETRSFAAAARRLGVTPSAVSRRVARLERELGVPLLARTTRSLRLTDDGAAFHERCVRVLDELREAREALARSSTRPSGVLRVDAPVALGRTVLAPALPRFLDRHPEVRVDLTLRDHHVDAAAEGLDVLVRIGQLGEPNLVARRLGESRVVHLASPAYLRRRGVPRAPADLARHDCVGYLRDGQPAPFHFVAPGGAVQAVSVAGRVHASDADALRALAVAGKGIVALFDFLARDELARGALVRVLPHHPGTTWPIHALYPKNRHLLPKVGVFLDFLRELLAAP
jgi:DNA-binding transcriptional LysR family regulator